jgi:hypothetical protein
MGTTHPLVYNLHSLHNTHPLMSSEPRFIRTANIILPHVGIVHIKVINHILTHYSVYLYHLLITIRYLRSRLLSQISLIIQGCA